MQLGPALVRRQGQLLNLRGEKTSEQHIAHAMATAPLLQDVLEYTTAEVANAATPHYQVLVETRSEVPLCCLTRPCALALAACAST